MAMMPLLYDYVVFVKLKLCCASGCFHADIKFIKDKLGVQCRFIWEKQGKGHKGTDKIG
jgi:hypothetical protein